MDCHIVNWHVGVMIGIEEYEAANAFAVTAALFAVLRFSRDTLIWTRRARIPQFIVAFVAIGVLLGLDLRWTAEQKSASEVTRGNLRSSTRFQFFNRELQR